MRSIKTKLQILLEDLKGAEALHLEVAQRMAAADNGRIFPVDLLANAVINRSGHLLRGFSLLVRERNFISAASLLRLQIDNCVRFHAVWLVKDPHDFASKVLGGEHVRKMKDQQGMQMTDNYLVDVLSQKHPWVKNVYARTSGYIHLSSAHFSNTVSRQELGTGIQAFSIGFTDNFPDDSLYEEATAAFIEATRTLFHYLVGWVATKERGPKLERDS